MSYARPATGSHPQRFAAPDARLYAELRRYGADDDAVVYAELSKFCTEGENAGKPGVCPGDAGGSDNKSAAAAGPKPAASAVPDHKVKLKATHAARQKAMEEHKEARRQAFNAESTQADDALARTKAYGSAIGEVSESIDVDIDDEDSEATEAAAAIDSAHYDLSEDAETARERWDGLDEIADAAKSLAQADDATAEHKAAATKIIGYVDKAKKELKQYVKHRKEMKSIRDDPNHFAERARAHSDAHLYSELIRFTERTSRTSKVHLTRFSEGGNSLHGVEIFAAGTHRGKTYTAADLDRMVANFKRASTGQKPGFRVPLVVGHEETQEYLERSDLPAAGWASRVWRDGKKLKADFDDVPPKVARLLKGKQYRTVSSEVYDDPPEGVPGDGKMLRRVALLGGDIPQIKSLDDIPEVETHSESHGFARGGRISLGCSDIRQSKTPGAFWVFSEVQKMTVDKYQAAGAKAMWAKVSDAGGMTKGKGKDKKYLPSFMKNKWAEMGHDEMIEALAGHGIDTGTLKDVPDEALAEMLRVCEDKDQNGTAQMDDDPDGDSDDKDKSDPFAEFADDALPEPKDDDEKKAFAEHARKYASRLGKFNARGKKYMEKYCSMSKNDDAQTPTDTTSDDMDDDPPSPATQPKKTTVTHQFNERQMQRRIDLAVERALNGRVKGKMDRFERFTERQLATQKQATVEAFCEDRLKQGKILSVELDPDNPANLYARLLRADASRAVRKFREGGKDVALTELDLQMREIDARPAFKFGEKLPSKGSKPGDTSDRKQWAQQTYEKFGEQFEATGVTLDTLVENATKADAKTFAVMQQDFDCPAG